MCAWICCRAQESCCILQLRVEVGEAIQNTKIHILGSIVEDMQQSRNAASIWEPDRMVQERCLVFTAVESKFGPSLGFSESKFGPRLCQNLVQDLFACFCQVMIYDREVLRH